MPIRSSHLPSLVLALFTLSACNNLNNTPNSAVNVLSNIQPRQLMLGTKTGNSAQRCVYAVQVINAEQACLQNECAVQAFYWPVKPIIDGQRALLVTGCSNHNQPKPGHLLSNQGPTGDSGILIFQNRREGVGLWQNVEMPNGDYGIQLATEAAEGVLSFHEGKYHWEENPD